MDFSSRDTLKEFYSRELIDNIVPFWMKYGLDQTYGGIITGLGQRGEIIDDDKGVWQQGRAAWLFSKLAMQYPERGEYREAAATIVRFIENYCTDPSDDRMWFHLTRDGQPIRKRRYAFSESFAAIAFSEYSQLTGELDYGRLAAEKFHQYLAWIQDPPASAAKTTNTRPMRSIGGPMIAINTAHELRSVIGETSAGEWIRWGIESIEQYHVHDAMECVFENVTPNGAVDLSHFDGRTLNPGHAIEAAWFIMWAGHTQRNQDWVRLGLKILDWMWERGWDKDYGGILYFVSATDAPVTEYWHDMKFWWPHNETIIATLLAWCLTGDPKYAAWHAMVHDWAFSHFADQEYGEWFGYLRRDGSVSNTLKGNLWKGPFHLPRMLMQCCEILDVCYPIELPRHP